MEQAQSVTTDRRDPHLRKGLHWVATVTVFMIVLVACGSGANIYGAARSPDGISIELSVGACNADLSLDVVETPESVTVKVTAQNEDTGSACADKYFFDLSEPLGERILIDGSDGEVLDVQIDEALGD
ncbi:hypothetical protein BMS3Bbin02_00992 [bacterium BMS3Bbin02]|nr:hypothetical protein BMS3Bbin02_00992 [bacterium BMS3Bbin02]